ncbi:hypothetical protein ABZ858_00205 [Streptomyces sp. NPDC047017]|uniref:hypothetical protein n=1 Tax=Streptomyces sp. NPDC047017 TaxID=3155024 RepID=UPI0033FF276B
MGRRLAAAVHVRHPVSHEWVVLEPGYEPDEDLAAEITNPHAWEEDDAASDDQPEPEPEPEPEPGASAGAEPAAEPPTPRRQRKTAETSE